MGSQIVRFVVCAVHSAQAVTKLSKARQGALRHHSLVYIDSQKQNKKASSQDQRRPRQQYIAPLAANRLREAGRRRKNSAIVGGRAQRAGRLEAIERVKKWVAGLPGCEEAGRSLFFSSSSLEARHCLTPRLLLFLCAFLLPSFSFSPVPSHSATVVRRAPSPLHPHGRSMDGRGPTARATAVAPTARQPIRPPPQLCRLFPSLWRL